MRRTLGAKLLVALLASVCLAAIAAPAASAAPEMYWGAYLGNQFDGAEPPYDMSGADAFEASVGKKMSLLEFTLPWAKCYSLPCDFLPFPEREMDAIHAHGSIPVFGWASYRLPVDTTQPWFQLRDIYEGDYDGFITRWATAARDWGHPFFLRFDWEMNICGMWAYSECRNDNRPGEYRAAWRHVHDIFTSVGASNVNWVWCPNVEYDGSIKPLAGLYPGAAYVDWTCLDGYNWGTNPAGEASGWVSFAKLFGPTYELITEQIAPGKPMMIAETASTEWGGSKAEWITRMFNQLILSFPNVKALLWFDRYHGSMDWQLETSPTAQQAFAEGIGSSRYATNVFGNLTRNLISPLSPLLAPLTGG
jgi:Glycosyl hydrolase family 26